MTSSAGSKIMPTALRLAATVAVVLLCLIQSQSQQVMAQELDLERLAAATPIPQPVAGTARGALPSSGGTLLLLSCVVTLFLSSSLLPALFRAASRPGRK